MIRVCQWNHPELTRKRERTWENERVFKSYLSHLKTPLLLPRQERGTEGAQEQMLLDFVGS